MAFNLSVLMVLFATTCLVEMASLDHSVQKRATTVCYERVGCFNNGPPFSDHRILNLNPQSPDVVLTQYVLFTRSNNKAGELLDARDPESYSTRWPSLQINKPIKFVIHGFLDSIYINTWQNATKDALLIHGDYNVVVVDWSKGNKPLYTQSVGNTRLIGAQIADLLQVLQTKASLNVSNVHLIGHSLGAHICGYAGERVPGVARISALDAAGPYFANTDRRVRLDETDAVFVDAIHSNAQSLLDFGLGITQSVGHADFFPNLGHEQPGCDRSTIDKLTATNDLLMGMQEVVSCDHLRAIKFFIESINTPCPFMSHPCASEEDYVAGKCYNCAAGTCSQMGYHADKVIPQQPTMYFLTTSDRGPFCENHIILSIHLKANSDTETGTLKVQFIGTQGTSPWIDLTDDDMDFYGGKTYTFYVGTPVDIGEVQSMKLAWKHSSSLLDPFHWNIFGTRHPSIIPDDIHVTQEEIHIDTHFCDDVNLETDQVVVVDNKC